MRKFTVVIEGEVDDESISPTTPLNVVVGNGVELLQTANLTFHRTEVTVHKARKSNVGSEASSKT